MIERIKALDRRAQIFIGVLVLLAVLAATGLMGVGRDVDIEREEAVAIARPHVDFEPEKADARLVRQGFQLAPVWAVSFSISADGSLRDFDRVTTVEVNARTGDVIRISVDDPGDES